MAKGDKFYGLGQNERKTSKKLGFGTERVDIQWIPTSVDQPFFVADRDYRVVKVVARVEVAGTDVGAVTAAVKKAASGTAIASGVALHQSTVNLKGTAATNQTMLLTATLDGRNIKAGDAIGVDFTGVLTAAVGCVTVFLDPR